MAGVRNKGRPSSPIRPFLRPEIEEDDIGVRASPGQSLHEPNLKVLAFLWGGHVALP